MVSGKPYISVNSATTNAEKAPIAFQSRRLRGWKKLVANRMKMTEFSTTRNHSPYPESTTTASACGVPLSRDDWRPRWARQRFPPSGATPGSACGPVRTGPHPARVDSARLLGELGRQVEARLPADLHRELADGRPLDEPGGGVDGRGHAHRNARMRRFP